MEELLDTIMKVAKNHVMTVNVDPIWGAKRYLNIESPLKRQWLDETEQAESRVTHALSYRLSESAKEA